MKKLFCLFAILGHFCLLGQVNSFNVRGKLRTENSVLDQPQAIVHPTGDSSYIIPISKNGKFQFLIPFGSDVILSFESQNHYSKKVFINLNNIDTSELNEACGMGHMDVLMIDKRVNIAPEVFQKPVGKIYFNESKQCFDWDRNFTYEKLQEIERLNKEFKKADKIENKVERIDEDIKIAIIEQQKVYYQPKLDSLEQVISFLTITYSDSLQRLSSQIRYNTSALNAIAKKEKSLRDSLQKQLEVFTLKKASLNDKIEKVKQNSELEIQLTEFQLQRLKAKTREDSIAIDQKELALLQSNSTLNNYIEQEQAKKEAQRKKSEQISRRNSLENSAIALCVFGLFGLLFIVGRYNPPKWLLELSVFLPFLILFEFLLVLTDPFVEGVTNGEPVFKLLINAGIAGVIFPLHSFFERFLKQRLFKST